MEPAFCKYAAYPTGPPPPSSMWFTRNQGKNWAKKDWIFGSPEIEVILRSEQTNLAQASALRIAGHGTNATPPASKDGVFNCSEQLRLTVDSGAPSRMARSPTVHCQSELQGTVENRCSLAGGVAFDILRCWKDDDLQTSEYSLQGKNKGEVTNTTENV